MTQGSDRAIINWNDFSIGAGQLTKFVQPSAASAILNRVTGNNPSALLGQLQANGQVFLINPHGVVVGQGASINAGGFTASTLDVSNTSFLAGGDLHLSGASPAAIVNLGSIDAAAGDIFLVAQQVTNQGSLKASGTAGLAAGTEVTLTQNGTEHVLVSGAVRAATGSAAVINSGTIAAAQAEMKAADGNLYALAINNTGVVRATGVQNIGGHIFLTGTGSGQVVAGGTLDASGSAGGGAIQVAGQTVSVPAGASLAANAGAAGNGGSVALLSTAQTDFAGTISARGGDQSGNGGSAEVSSHGTVSLTGSANLLAPAGTTGTLLIDPTDVTISSTATVNDPVAGGTYTPTAGALTSNILNTELEAQLATANVTVVTASSGLSSGTITVAAPVTWSAGTSLTLSANSSIAVNANVTQTGATSGGAVVLSAGSGSGISLGAGVAVSAASAQGAVTLKGDSLTLGAGATIGATGTSGSVNFAPATTSTGIDLGGTTGGDLQLSTAALNAVTATTLVVGSSAGSGNVLVSSALAAGAGGALEHVANLTLNGGSGTMAINSAVTTPTGGIISLISTRTVNQGASGVLTTSGAGGLELSGPGATFNLASAANAVNTVAGADAGGTISLSNGATALSVGTVGGAAGLTATTLTLGGTGTIAQTAPVTSTNLALTGTGAFALTDASNAFGTFAASVGAGTITLTDSSAALSIDKVGSTSGVTAASLTLNSTGTVTTAQPITVTNLTLQGAGATYDLSGANSVVGNLTASVGSGTVSYAGGTSNVALGAITAGTIVINDTGTVTQTAPLAGALALVGSGGIYNLTNPANAVSVLASSVGTGTVSLNNGANPLSIGSVGPAGKVIVGANAGMLTLTDTGLVTQTQAINANLELLGAGGSYTLNNLANKIGTLSGNTGSVNLTDGSSVIITTVGGTTNLTTSAAAGLFLSDSTAGGITLAAAGGAIIANGGPVTLATNGLFLNNTITATGQTVTLQAFTPGASVDAGGHTAGDLAVSAAAMNQIFAGTLALGSATATVPVKISTTLDTLASDPLEHITNLTLLGGSGGIAINSPIALAANGILTLNTTGSATQSAGFTTTGTGGLLLLGTGTFTLNGPGNSVPTIAGNVGAGTISYSNGSSALSIGSLLGTSGLTAGTLTFTNSGVTTQTTIITVTYFELLGAGGTYTLTNSGNQIQNLSGNTGTVTLTDGNTLTLATSGGTSNLTASGNVSLTDTAAGGIVSGATGAITAGNITLQSDAIALGAAATTPGTLALLPNTVNGSIGIGSGAGLLTVSQSELTSFAKGATLQIGGATSTGAVAVGGAVALPSAALTTTIETAGAISVTTGNSLSTAATGATIALQTNTTPILSGALSTASSSDGTIIIEPLTAGTTLGLGTGAGTIQMAQTALNNLTTGTVQLGSAAATGALTVGGSVSAPATVRNLTLETQGLISIPASNAVTDTHSGGVITLQTDTSPALSTDSVVALGGTAVVTPVTVTKGIDVGGTTAGYLQLPTATLSGIDVSTLQVGSGLDSGNPLLISSALSTAADSGLTHVTNLSLTGGAANIALNQPITLASTGILTLSTTATATQANAAPITLAGANSGLILLGAGGVFNLTSLTNSVPTLAANTDSLSVTDSIPLTVNTVGSLSNLTATKSVVLTDDHVTLTAGTGQITDGTAVGAPGETVQIAPYTANAALGFYETGGAVNLIQSTVGLVNAKTLIFGSSAATGSLTVGNNVTLPTTNADTVNNLVLQTAGLITLPTGTSLTAPAGDITLQTDTTPVLTGTGLQLTASGTVYIQPQTASTTMGLGTGAGTLQLVQASINQISATTLQFGAGYATGALTGGGAVTTPATITNVTLATQGQINLSGGNSLTDSHTQATITLASDLTPTLSPGSVGMGTLGTVAFTPASSGKGVDIGGTTAGALLLTAVTLNDVAPVTTLQIGSAFNVPSFIKVSTGSAMDATTGDSLAHAANLTLDAGGGGIQINAPIVTPVTGVLTLNTSGSDTQTAAITTSGTGSGLVLLGAGGVHTLTNSANSITTLAGATGTVTLVDSVPVTVNTVTLSTGPVTTANLTATGPVSLTDDAIVVTTQILAAGQAVSLQPQTLSNGVDIGGTTAGYLDLTSASLGNITAGTLILGNTADTTRPVIVDTAGQLDVAHSLQNITSLTLIGGAGAININQPVTLATGGVLTLNTTGQATQTATSVITDTGGLLLQGTATSDFELSTAPNSVATLAGNLGGASSGIIRLNNGGAALSLGTVGAATGVTDGLLSITDAGTVTQSQTLSVSQLLLLGSGGTFTLTNSGNVVSTLAANIGAGTISLNDGSTALSVGAVSGTNGVAAGTLSLSDRGTVTQTQPVNVSNLELLGTHGTYAFTNAGNTVGVLAADTASVSLTDGTALSIGSVNNTVGATANTVVLSDTGMVTQTQPIVGNLVMNGSGGQYTLNNANNIIQNAAGSTGSVSLTDAIGLTVTTVSGTSNLTTTLPAGIALTDSSGSGITLSGTGGALSSSGSGPITLTSDFISLSNSTVSAPTQTVTLQPFTTTIGVDVGGATTPGFLNLSVASLNQVSANTLVIGNVADNTNPLKVDQLLDTSGSGALHTVTNLTLLGGTGSGAGIDLNDPITMPTGGVLTFDTVGGNGGTQTSAGVITTSGATGGLQLLGSGTTYTLNAAKNAGTQLAATVGIGVVKLSNVGTNLSIGSVGTTSGVTANTLVLSDNNPVTQTQPISAQLDVLGSGSYTLNNAGNDISTLAGNSGAVALTDGAALTINSVNGTNNLSSSGAVTLIADSITLAGGAGGNIRASGQTVTLQPLTAGTAITVGGVASGFDLTAAQLQDVTATTLVIGSAGTVGNASGAISVTAASNPGSVNNLALLSGSTVAETTGSAITVGGLEVSGTVDTLAENNAVSTLAMKGTGALSFNDTSALTIGTVNGLYGVNTSGGTILVKTGSNLTIASGGSQAVSGAGAGDAVQLVDNGTFTNSQGASALSVTSGGGRWLVWSLNPANDTRGSIPYGFKQYAATFGTTVPADSTNNGVLYTVTPTATPTLTGTITKPYDGNTSAVITTGNYGAVLGAIDGDTVVLSKPTTNTTATYDNQNVAGSPAKTITATGINQVSATDANGAVYGYTIVHTATGPIGEITPLTLTYTATGASQTYGTAIPTLSGTITGFLTGESVASATTGTMAFTTTATQSSNVATYPITGGGLTANGGNYVFAQAAGNSTAFAITPATLTYTTNPVSQTYGTDLPTFTGTVSGYVLGQDSSVLTGTASYLATSATAASDVGSYAVNGSGLTANHGNYTFVQAASNATALTITAATLTYNATPISQVYATAIPTLGGTVTGYVLGQDQTSATTGTLAFTTTAVQTSNVGNYPIVGSGLTANHGDYVFVQNPANATAFTITPATLTLVYNAAPVTQTYGTAIPTLTGTVSGFLLGDTQSNATTGTLVFTTTATQSSNVGTYPITGSGLTANNGNYTFIQNPANANAFAITPATLTYNAAPVSQIYGTAIPGLTGTVTGFVLGQTVGTATTGTTSFTTTATQSSNVGTYATNGSGLTANNGNYVFVQNPANATAFAITPATLTYNATPTTNVYGSPIPALGGSVTGFVLGQTVASATTGGTQFSTTATQSSNVGTYSEAGFGLTANNGNYVFVQNPSNATAFTVTPATLTLVYNATPVSQTYGTAIPTLTGSVSGFLLGDTQANATSGTLVFSTTATQSSNVGTYPITGSGLTANNGNYTFIQNPANANAFAITPATLTYTTTPVSQIYGTAIPTLSGTVTGFVLGQNLASSTTGAAAFTTAATQSSNVGTYTTQGSGLTANNGNYVFAQASSNATAFNITPATLTYNAALTTNVYGSAIPSIGGTVTGFVLGQTLATATTGTTTFTTVATPSSNVGTYAETGSGLTANNGNYAFVQNPANATAFQITPATLTYTSAPVSLIYGSADPTFSGTLSGFVLGQTQASSTTGTISFTSPATQSSGVGSYPINGGGLAANNGDYIFVQAPLNATALTINPATLTYVATPATLTSGQPVTGLTGNVTGFVLTDTLASATSGTLGWVSTATGSSPAGTYPIDGAGLTSANYTLVQAAPNATALTLQVPIDNSSNNGVTTAITHVSDLVPPYWTFFDNNGSNPTFTFEGGDGEPVSDVTAGRASTLPPDTGGADTAISLGRLVVRYRTVVIAGRETVDLDTDSLGYASSFTTFDKRDHPASRIKHGKGHGQDKVPVKNENPNAPAGTL